MAAENHRKHAGGKTILRHANAHRHAIALFASLRWVTVTKRLRTPFCWSAHCLALLRTALHFRHMRDGGRYAFLANTTLSLHLFSLARLSHRSLCAALYPPGVSGTEAKAAPALSHCAPLAHSSLLRHLHAHAPAPRGVRRHIAARRAARLRTTTMVPGHCCITRMAASRMNEPLNYGERVIMRAAGRTASGIGGSGQHRRQNLSIDGKMKKDNVGISRSGWIRRASGRRAK